MFGYVDAALEGRAAAFKHVATMLENVAAKYVAAMLLTVRASPDHICPREIRTMVDEPKWTFLRCGRSKTNACGLLPSS
ncbi:hypothetical protein RHGRI_028545 [Rhododendron griersonianum]|uniref:Uncharacterized protein n=1 Tax=Rhododendron griersonianum TaxID=479676 RepID=A0AAV6IJH7_9ERIC|nr:hypothetical protein RHGRI_028545 [Rhododendron griersonianum]